MNRTITKLRLKRQVKCLDVNEAANYAAHQSEEEHSLFSSVLSTVVDDDNNKRPALDQEANEMAIAHDRIYNQGCLSQASPADIGKAAALQAHKMTTSGTGCIPGSSELIGLAMGEAMKLLKDAGGAGGENQNEALRVAAATAMRLYVSKGRGSQSSGAGGTNGSVGLAYTDGLDTNAGSGGINAAMLSKLM
ncbi:hypothetical protein BCR42DRAFT_426107 [Absidia repens]|uniref:DUF7721 domain-containing protein n=1 Tax=Absidia repens TaxID=90262 RepID=A0A1X2I1R8_9FUNG|nr:hypothetical protein BCR42DRAFT_426107 [Absidia repens]